MQDNADYQYLGEKIAELNALYKDIKKDVISLENYADNKTYVSLFNELRDALDHIFEATQKSEQKAVDEQMGKVKGHLERVGYDVFELYAGYLGARIVKMLDNIDSDIISIVFPAYYREHRPLILEIQETLADVRANKKPAQEAFDRYRGQIVKLNNIEKEISRYIPDLKKEQNKKKKNKVLMIVIPIVTTFLGVIITYFLSK